MLNIEKPLGICKRCRRSSRSGLSSRGKSARGLEKHASKQGKGLCLARGRTVPPQATSTAHSLLVLHTYDSLETSKSDLILR